MPRYAPPSKETRRKISATLKGHIVSKETREKISKKLKGFKHSKETKEKMSKTRKGKPSPLRGTTRPISVRQKQSKSMKGKKQSPEHIKKRVESRLKNNNYSHSPETIEKISKIKKGIKLTKEHREKISKGSKGKKLSEEHKQKLSKTKKGIRRTPEEKAKISRTLTGRKLCRRSGTGHWNWQGGISKQGYCDAWTDKEYKKTIIERDGKCRNPECWNKDCKLSVHHINYDKEDCHPSNLITLCLSCNSRANFNKEKWEKLFGKIIQDNGWL